MDDDEQPPISRAPPGSPSFGEQLDAAVSEVSEEGASSSESSSRASGSLRNEVKEIRRNVSRKFSETAPVVKEQTAKVNSLTARGKRLLPVASRS